MAQIHLEIGVLVLSKIVPEVSVNVYLQLLHLYLKPFLFPSFQID